MDKIIKGRDTSKWFEYLFLIFIILWSGGGFTYGLFPRWMFVAFPILGAIFLVRRIKLTQSELIVIAILYCILLLQALKHGGAFITTLTPLFTIIVCAMFARLINHRFVEIYTKIIYYISYITLVLWLISLFPVGLRVLRAIATAIPQLGWDNFVYTTNVVDTLYVYSIPREINGVVRNSGPFWEPGRFTIFITIAIAINLFYKKQPLFTKQNLILILTNITTFSTTGYIAMGVLFVGYTFFARLKQSQKYLIILCLCILIPYIIQLDFIAEKIQAQAGELDVTWSRFGAIVYHWGQIKQSPIIGYGPFLLNVTDELMLSPNGLTDLVRYYGIPASLLLYTFLYKGTQLYIGTTNNKFNVCAFVVILILCFSQTITISPFFYLLYFFSLNSIQKCTQK